MENEIKTQKTCNSNRINKSQKEKNAPSCKYVMFSYIDQLIQKFWTRIKINHQIKKLKY